MKSKHLAVVGLGYVGLPVALVAAKKGYTTIGYDIDSSRVDAINAGVSPIEDAALSAALVDKPIVASTQAEVVADAEVVVVAVPTPVTATKEPDLTPLTSALESILPYLQTGQLLSIESTINPGVMQSVVAPILATREDLELDVVHCPERVNPGDTKWTVGTIPRVIGGFTDAATKRGKEFYESILDAPVKAMATVMEAEAVKILENTFRDINIAFVNEMARSFDALGIDITNVIDGAATKPFAFMPHYPGNGVGGHCISVDPYYMIQKAKEVGFDHEFLRLARKINDGMPEYTVNLLRQALEKKNIPAADATVVLLGLSYKKNIDDIRESPAIAVRKQLEQEGFAKVRVFDPHVLGQSTVQTLDEALVGATAVIIGCDHDEFTSAVTADRLTQEGIHIVIDGKNSLDMEAISAAGVYYHGVGRGA